MFRIHFNCYEFRKVSYFKCFKLFVVNIEENEDKTRLSMTVYELIHCVTFCSIMYVPKSCNIFNQGQSFLSNGNRRRLWPLFKTLSWLNPKSLHLFGFPIFWQRIWWRVFQKRVFRMKFKCGIPIDLLMQSVEFT